ncbi:putative ribonuclease H protein [Vitis vinifera]|uniref:Putative ribonuclease H protein n=1 Tax=Vitis vinifera TaxID=29760 RepID=A0A438CN80_VITVI|nr:putative ribonuclease H protein [Vitis vinifera]
MGFGEKWAGWIRWCIATASFSVLINGSLAGFFQSTRGLRQGDPISPYLFILGMEALSCLINKAVRGGFLSDCRLRGRGGNGIQVSHLLFADDTLVFCKDSQDQMAVLSWLLMWFEAIFGLNINLEKSEILPVGRVENAEVLASELGCKVGSLPSTYLGLPLGAPHKSVVVWDGVEERMRKRLALWKRQFISKGGRITLIRSTLASMPIYLMSLMHIPRVVRLRLEKIQRDFLWGGGALEKRPHLVKWDVVRSHKMKGGLGIRNFSILNRALLCKWSWRFAAERESFWKLIISTKYGEEGGGWISCEGMVEGCVGSGLLGFYGDAGGWHPCFSRSFNDWELEAVASLLSVLQGKRLNAGLEDRVVWNASKNGIFSVKSLYNTLDSGGAVSFPWRIIWSPCVPTKVGFFAWEASWGKVLTQDQLKRRGWSLANRCFLCCDDEETINHILIHCPKLETFKRQLMQSLSDDNSSQTETVDIGTCDQSIPKAYPDIDDGTNGYVVNQPLSGFTEYRNSTDEADCLACSFKACSAKIFCDPIYHTALHSKWNPKNLFYRWVPRGYSAVASPNKTSGATSPTKSQYDGRGALSSWYPSSQQSSAANSPPRARPLPGSEKLLLFSCSFLAFLIFLSLSNVLLLCFPLSARTPRIDGKEFFRQARQDPNAQLTYLLLFICSTGLLNKIFNMFICRLFQETLRKAEEIFGTDNKDLYLSFQGLLNRNPH